MIELVKWAPALFGVASAVFWFWAALVRLPRRVVPVYGGGGNIQVLADAVRKQSLLNAIAAFLAALAVLFQGLFAAS